MEAAPNQITAQAVPAAQAAVEKPCEPSTKIIISDEIGAALARVYAYILGPEWGKNAER